MELRVLGADGGIGDHRGTTSLQISPRALIDAGTGLEALELEAMLGIERVYLSHAHLDHTACLPLLVDAQFAELVAQGRQLEIVALPEVIQALHQHLFNGTIWPDFSRLPDPAAPVLRFTPLSPWQEQPLPSDAPGSLMAFPVPHGTAACGFRLRDAQGRQTVFTGDTTLDDSLVEALDALGDIDLMLLECSFPDRLTSLARLTGHMTPTLVATLLARMARPPQRLWLGHMKPGYRLTIQQELSTVLRGRQWRCL